AGGARRGRRRDGGARSARGARCAAPARARRGRDPRGARAVKPLRGRRIVVTRPSGQAGGEALKIPAIEIRPLEDTALFARFVERLGTFDLVIFVSRNAVQSGL